MTLIVCNSHVFDLLCSFKIVNNYPMTKNKLIYHLSHHGLVNDGGVEILPRPFLDLCSEHDKSVYFCSWGGYILIHFVMQPKCFVNLC